MMSATYLATRGAQLNPWQTVSLLVVVSAVVLFAIVTAIWIAKEDKRHMR